LTGPVSMFSNRGGWRKTIHPKSAFSAHLTVNLLCVVCAVRREEDREAKDFSRLKSG
jgi:hypothetical protein